MIDMVKKVCLIEVSEVIPIYIYIDVVSSHFYLFLEMWFSCNYFLLGKVAIMTRISWADSHSVIQMMSSGNSLEAEIHLQISLVGACLIYIDLMKRKIKVE